MCFGAVLFLNDLHFPAALSLALGHLSSHSRVPKPSCGAHGPLRILFLKFVILGFGSSSCRSGDGPREHDGSLLQSANPGGNPSSGMGRFLGDLWCVRPSDVDSQVTTF